MVCKDGAIARLTTPSIIYKPSQVEINEVDKIFLVVSQNGVDVIVKDRNEAAEYEDGFLWYFSQEDTARLQNNVKAMIQIDYTTENGARYTTIPKGYLITNSAIKEVV